MKKKIMALLLTLALCVGLFAGCGQAQPRELTQDELQDILETRDRIVGDYVEEMTQRLKTPLFQLDNALVSHIRRDGESFIAEATLYYQPNETMLADGFWWGETSRWEGDWCKATRQILINKIDGEWQYGGSATDGLDTEDFRELTEEENRAVNTFLGVVCHRTNKTYTFPFYDGGWESTVLTDLQVTDAAPDHFTGLTLEEEPREITVEMPQTNLALVPRRGDRVRVTSGPLEEGAASIPLDKLFSVIELLPEDE